MKPTLPLLIVLLAFMGCKDVKKAEKGIPVNDSLPPTASSAEANEEISGRLCVKCMRTVPK